MKIPKAFPMALPNRLKDPLLRAIDGAMALIPRPAVGHEVLDACQVIAHRGVRDALGEEGGVRENTIAAFERAEAAAAWGIEFDVRWTSCGEPIIHHDPTTKRVFGDPTEIGSSTFREIKSRLREIPSLDEIISRFGRRLHLMIEIKDTLDRKRLSSLASLLKALEPGRDYHLMSLETKTLLACDFVPRQTCLPIAELNVRELSDAAIRHGFGGLTSQYALMPTNLVRRHHDARQKVGTGFIGSRSVLLRELHRGVDWIFTDHADRITALLRRELQLTPHGLESAK